MFLSRQKIDTPLPYLCGGDRLQLLQRGAPDALSLRTRSALQGAVVFHRPHAEVGEALLLSEELEL